MRISWSEIVDAMKFECGVVCSMNRPDQMREDCSKCLKSYIAARIVASERSEGINTVSREFQRRPVEGIVNYSKWSPEASPPLKSNLFGSMVDISDSGIGIRTTEQIEINSILAFTSASCRNKIGIVKWCRRDNVSDMYRAGVKFVNVEPSRFFLLFPKGALSRPH
jgi:hypothetical protein